MSSRDAIDTLVREFVAELEKLVVAAALESVQSALRARPANKPAPAKKARAKAAPAGKAAPAAPAAASAASGGKRKKGEKRSPAELAAVKNRLEAFVSANPGKRIEEIGKALSMPTSDLSRPMKKLIDGGSVRVTGERRATKYFPAKKK
jgi:3-oxoacyl-ACP reductase-like protein